jgi:hypothetical protein
MQQVIRPLSAEIASKLNARPEFAPLTRTLNYANTQEGGTEMGNSFAFLLALRQYFVPQPHFLVDDSLLELLDNTDISKELSMDTLKLPFPRCFIEFGTSRQLRHKVPNTLSGLHALEGVYCESGSHPAFGEGLYFMLTGSPLGKSGPLDDATNSVFLASSPAGRPLAEALQESAALAREVSRQSGLNESPKEFLDYAQESLEFLAKVLLYISLPECRRDVQKGKSLAQKAVASKKSAAKQRKAQKRAARQQDVILIQAAPGHLPPQDDAGHAHGRKVRAHWRRGHYRMHAHGPALALRKVIFVQPVLVAATETAASSVEQPDYLVR